jgi:hypothetical protein
VSSIAIPRREGAGNSEDLGGYLGGGISKVEEKLVVNGRFLTQAIMIAVSS